MSASLLLWGILTFVILAAATMAWWFRNQAQDTRSWNDYILDIRAMNEYNAHFVAAIVIFLGFALLETRVAVPASALRMLLGAFTAGGMAMFFFPIHRQSEAETVKLAIKVHWIIKVLASQATVVFSVFGIWAIILETM